MSVKLENNNLKQNIWLYAKPRP